MKIFIKNYGMIKIWEGMVIIRNIRSFVVSNLAEIGKVGISFDRMNGSKNI